MTRVFTVFIVLLAAGAIEPVLADVSVSSPLARAIYQRDAEGQASVSVAGTFDDADVDRVEVRFLPREGASGTATDWMAAEVTDGAFVLSLTLAQGWYDVHARTVRGVATVTESVVPRVGVGEIFVTAGQSNSANHGQPRLRPMDDRVSAWGGGTWRHAADPQPIATGDGGTPWPPLGDLLAAELDVPIGFISVGWGGTSVGQWLGDGNLYPRLREALEALGDHGLRAILWHQGESDHVSGTTTAQYVERLRSVISQSRQDAGFEVPWGVALVSFVPNLEPPTSAAVIAGQRQVIESVPGVFEGPATDRLTGFDWRHDGIHFNEPGLREHARLWAESIEAYFDLSSRPVARIRLAAKTVEEGAALEIRGESSEAFEDRRIVSWEWDFGDGSAGEGVSVTHTYAKHGVYTVRLQVTDDAGEMDDVSESVVVVVRPESVEPWRVATIGPVGFGSGERADGECLLLAGGGDGLLGFDDDCRFLYQQVTGDVRLTARLAELTTSSSGASAGILLRASLATDSLFASTLRRVERDVVRISSTRRQRTLANRRSSFETNAEWLRIERRGAELTSSVSEDGVTWLELERLSLDLGETYLAGLAVASLGDQLDRPAFARFCDVALEVSSRAPFVRGDCRGDGRVNGVSDAVFLLAYAFFGGPSPGCLEACDVDADGEVLATTDALYLLQFAFRGGPPPPVPYPQCGVAPGAADNCVTTSARCR